MQTTKKSVLTVDDEVFVFTLHRRTQTDADTQPRPDTDHRFLSLTPRPQRLPASCLACFTAFTALDGMKWNRAPLRVAND